MKGYLSDKDYSFIYSNSPRICVDLIIKSRKGIFLTKRESSPYKGRWHLPGGRVRFRETIDKAIKRIAKQEVGVQINNYTFIGYMEFLKEIQNKENRHTISLGFLITSIQPIGGKYFKISPNNIIPEHKKFLIKNKYIL